MALMRSLQICKGDLKSGTSSRVSYINRRQTDEIRTITQQTKPHSLFKTGIGHFG